MNDAHEPDPNNGWDAIAADLDAVESVPDDVLRHLVTRDGACMAFYELGLVPDWSGDDLTDRQVAARICAGCPVQRECLELELRTQGAGALGVWGALPADDVRELHPVWQARRRGRPADHDLSGGERP